MGRIVAGTARQHGHARAQLLCLQMGIMAREKNTHGRFMLQSYQASLTACALRLPKTSAQFPLRTLHMELRYKQANQSA